MKGGIAPWALLTHDIVVIITLLRGYLASLIAIVSDPPVYKIGLQ